MWIRKCYKDQAQDMHSPVPTEIVSNEEFVPAPQTRQQKLAEAIMFEDARRYAKKLGMDRRAFMRSAGGIFCGFLALNKVFGKTWDVCEEMIFNPETLKVIKEVKPAQERNPDYVLYDPGSKRVFVFKDRKSVV